VSEGEPLTGDGVTQGIVRIGDTVRRPLRDPRDRAPAFADADIPHRVAVFADAYGMTARHRAELAPFAVDMARRYHEHGTGRHARSASSEGH
jgi:hypothetical protein